MNRAQALAKLKADRERMKLQRSVALDAAADAVGEAIGPAVTGTRDIIELVDVLGRLYDEGYKNGNADAYRAVADEQREQRAW